MAHNKSAWIFCVGRELLEGIVLDRNAHYIATRLSDQGVKVRSIQTVDGVLEEMAAALRAALATKPDYVFCTGGLGPAHDDITRDAVAEVTGCPLVLDPLAVKMIEISYRRLHAKGVTHDPSMNESRLRMAKVPKGTKLLENPIGAGPACVLESKGTTFIILPGVPEEMQRLFSLHIAPMLREAGAGSVRKTRAVEYGGRDESAIARVLADTARRFPGVSTRTIRHGTEEGVKIRITLFGEGTDARALDELLDRAEADLRARLGVELANQASADIEDL